MKLYREWCLKPEFRKGTMLPESRFKTILLSGDPGYSSVYAFEEDAALALIDQKSSAGMARFTAHTDSLVIDLDNGDDQLAKALEKIAALGLAHEVWSSGSKGYHIYIPHTQHESGHDVPHSQRLWVEALDVGADLSLYQHGRILSLPGRVHPKTGRRKALVSNTPGQALALVHVTPPPSMFNFEARGGLSEFEAGLWKCLQSLGTPPDPGMRHTRIWSTAQHFADCGLTYEATLTLLLKVNEQWPSPKDPSEVELAVTQAFRKNLSPHST